MHTTHGPHYSGPRHAPGQQGASLIYFIGVLVVLSTLVAGMVTLFRSSANIVSKTNHPKRAYYMAESGVRYLETQLINAGAAGLSLDSVTGRINSIPRFIVDGDQQFEAKVYKLGSLMAISSVGVPGNQIFDLKNGDESSFSSKFTIPIYVANADAVYLVNSQELAKINALEYAEIKATSLSADHKILHATVGKKIDPPDGPFATIQNEKDAMSYFLAVQQRSQKTVTVGGSVVGGAGSTIFPKKNGMITLNNQDGCVNNYTYSERVANGDGTYTFTNLQHPFDEGTGEPSTWIAGDMGKTCTGGDDMVVKTNHWIILNSKYNKNMWGDVTGYSGSGSAEVSKNLAPTFFAKEGTGTPKGALSFKDSPHNIVKSDPSKQPIVWNQANNTITIGANEVNAFGAIWYSGTKRGVNLNCIEGKCDFGQGIRAFFTSQFTLENADGFVFAVINSTNNTYNAIGGDSSLGELLAWAGDGRVYRDNTGVNHQKVKEWVGKNLDGSTNKNGIQPPKFGLEFDTYDNSWYTPEYNKVLPLDLCYPRNRDEPNGNGICWRNAASSEFYDVWWVTKDPMTSFFYDPVTNTCIHPTPYAKKHLSHVFWGKDPDPESGCPNGLECKNQLSESANSPTTEGLASFDDNKHGAGYNTASSGTHGTGSVQPPPDNVFVATDANQQWWTVGNYYATRHEIHRELTETTTAPNAGKYKYTMKTWVRKCADATCSEYICQAVLAPYCPIVGNPRLDNLGDLDRDFNVTTSGDTYKPVLVKEIYLTEAQHQMVDTVLIGFTEATGASTQFATIGNYQVKFRAGGDERAILTRSFCLSPPYSLCNTLKF